MAHTRKATSCASLIPIFHEPHRLYLQAGPGILPDESTNPRRYNKMNTLSKAVTARFFPTENSYNTIRNQWRVLVNSEHRHELTTYHHLFYLALLGKDWRKAFTPPSNRRKLENGAFLGWSMFRALQALHNPLREQELLAPWAGFVTHEMLQALRTFLPLPNPCAYQVDQFTEHTFPFDAYTDETNAITRREGESHE
jgi:hypothetical protein